ncbi:hypothetical protein Golob_027975 [Gossypium lobatum]|uniref:DUF4283 domain-containing protein n=1 Tax=Gossypium lobatum TaxID=34289 RepID=A0A7J8NEK8_9ROSI|nr:hypothetical protein [Gossypium lobatum]
MANVDLVHTELANLNIIDDEEDPMVVLEENKVDEEVYDLCLVGRVLTDSVVNFPSIRNTLADLWHPLRGVSITKLENKRILFRFYSEIDLKRILDGMPWFFNRHLIIFHKLAGGEDPNSIPLWLTAFWVQVHNLPIGATSEGTARQLATPRREGQAVSKWLREEPEKEKWNMEIDGESRVRRSDEEVKNRNELRGEVGSLGRFTR